MRLSRPKSGSIGEPITALIDVVFFLLVFFMLIGRMDATSPFEVAPPEARTGQDLPAGGLTVSMAADGALALDGVRMTTAELDAALENAVSPAPPRLRINAHRHAQVRNLLPLIARAEGMGYADIALIVTPPSQSTPKGESE